MTDWLWVCLGAALGAPARYLTDRAVQRLHATRVPYGTLSVNLVGAFALGVVAGSGAGDAVALAVGTGFCGAYTTWSTLSYELLRLGERRHWRALSAYLVLTLAGGLLAAWAGLSVVG